MLLEAGFRVSVGMKVCFGAVVAAKGDGRFYDNKTAGESEREYIRGDRDNRTMMR